MLGHIFVNNDNNVETYLIDINLEKLKELKKRIDIWNGKGETKTNTGRYLSTNDDKKIEILSKKRIINNKNHNYFGYLSSTPIYEFRYKEYNQHELSKICEWFLNNYDNNCEVISTCSNIKRLLDFNPTDNKERKYFYEILSCFTFKQYACEDIVESDIDLSDKISILAKLKTLLTKSHKTNQEKHFLPQSYMDLINAEIKRKEYISSQKRYCTVKYTDEYKNHLKKKTLFSLPQTEKLEKYNLI